MSDYTGTTASDTLTGTDADDVFRPLTGIDTVAGGGGTDRLIVDYSAFRVAFPRLPSNVALGADGWAGSVESRVGDDVVSLSGIERLDVRLGGANDGFVARLLEPVAGRTLTVDAGGGTDRFMLIAPTLAGVTFRAAANGGVANNLGLTLAGFEQYEVRVGGGTNMIATGDGADTIEAGVGVSAIAAGGGDDLIVTHAGRDRIEGGAGSDIWVIDLVDSAAAVSLRYNGVAGTPYLEGQSFASGIEQVRATFGSGNDSARLTDVSRSSVSGGAGADGFTIIRPTAVTIDGGAGADQATVDLSGTTRFYESALYADGTGGFAGTLSRYDGIDLTGIERLSATLGDGDDLVSVDAAAFLGGARLLLDGGAGIDTLSLDLAAYDGAKVAVRTDGSILLGVNLLLGFESFRLTGSAGADELTGGRAGNVIDGGGGNDVLRGGAGADRIYGGAGNDRINGFGGADELYGGAGDDTYHFETGGPLPTVQEAFGEGIDTVASGFSFGLSENVEKLTLTGTRDISGTGNDAANVLTGNAGANLLQGLGGADTIVGGAGADYLIGGAGADILTGGADADLFAFDTLETSTERDILRDFTPGEDRLQIDGDVFAAFSGAALGSALAVENFRLGARALDADDFLIYDRALGALYYDADGSGAQEAVQIASLTTKPLLSTGDFVLV